MSPQQAGCPIVVFFFFFFPSASSVFFFLLGLFFCLRSFQSGDNFSKRNQKIWKWGKSLAARTGQGRDAARAEHTQHLQGAGRTWEAFSSEKVSEVNWAGQCSDKGLIFCNLLICDSTVFFLKLYIYFFLRQEKKNT